jgi:hypothetical protein
MRYTRMLAAGSLVLALGGCGDEKPAPPATPPPVMTPMTDDGFRVEWGTPGVPTTIGAGSEFAVGVVVKNVSDQIWMDPRNADAKTYGAGAVRLAYRWWKAGDTAKPYRDYGSERGDLLAPIHPGQSAALAVPVTAPQEPGRYRLQLDLLQEIVSFFQDRGALTLMVPVTVTAQRGAAAGQRPAPSSPAVRP